MSPSSPPTWCRYTRSVVCLHSAVVLLPAVLEEPELVGLVTQNLDIKYDQHRLACVSRAARDGVLGALQCCSLREPPPAGIGALTTLSSLTALTLSEFSWKPSQLAQLTSIRNLQHISLTNFYVSAQELSQSLSCLPQSVTHVEFDMGDEFSQDQDPKLHCLAGLQSGFAALRSLRLKLGEWRGCKISLQPLVSIQGNLQSLQLGRLHPSVSLQPLRCLTNLTDLEVYPCEAASHYGRAESFDWMSSLTSLRVLVLSGTIRGDLQPVSCLVNLKSCTIEEPDPDMAGLLGLTCAQGLTHLGFPMPGYSPSSTLHSPHALTALTQVRFLEAEQLELATDQDQLTFLTRLHLTWPHPVTVHSMVSITTLKQLHLDGLLLEPQSPGALCGLPNNLSPLRGLTNLELTFDLRGSELEFINGGLVPLATLPSLEVLRLHMDISAFPYLGERESTWLLPMRSQRLLKPLGLIKCLYELAIWGAPAVRVAHFNAIKGLGVLTLNNCPCVDLQGCTLDYASMLRVSLDDRSVSLSEANIAELCRLKRSGVLVTHVQKPRA